jgi:hypothetical protein
MQQLSSECGERESKSCDHGSPRKQDELTSIYDKRISQAMRGLAMQSGKNEWRTSETSTVKSAKELVPKAIDL